MTNAINFLFNLLFRYLLMVSFNYIKLLSYQKLSLYINSFIESKGWRWKNRMLFDIYEWLWYVHGKLTFFWSNTVKWSKAQQIYRYISDKSGGWWCMFKLKSIWIKDYVMLSGIIQCVCSCTHVINPSWLLDLQKTNTGSNANRESLMEKLFHINPWF